MPDPSLSLRSIGAKPGVRRDGAVVTADYYTETVWARFDQMGMPRKMGGYEGINPDANPNPIRGVAYNFDGANGTTVVHFGSSNNLFKSFVNNTTLAGGSYVDRTPVGLPASTNRLWKIDHMLDGGSGGIAVIAKPTDQYANLADPGNVPIYWGDLLGAAPLTAIGSPPTSNTSGIVALFPYLVAFGNNGYVAWSVPNTPNDFLAAGSGEANITNSKIVEGRILRSGPGNNPAGLLWSMDSLIRMSFVGGAAVFDFDTISSGISIMSPRSVVEYDGVYYWAGNDRFYMFNGVVRPLPNPLNSDFFFNGVQLADRSKIYAFTVPRWNEIWWCFPLDGAGEANWAVIYNTLLGTWYDTPLPEDGRTDGINLPIIGRPLMFSITDPVSGMWMHETGVDKSPLIGANEAILSSFTTPYISAPYPPPGAQPNNAVLTCEIFEVDFLQAEDMTVEIIGQPNPKGTVTTTAQKTFSPTDVLVNFKQGFRLQRLKFTSDAVGGDYVSGGGLGHFKPAGERVT